MSYCDEPNPKWTLVAVVAIVLLLCWCEWQHAPPMTPGETPDLPAGPLSTPAASAHALGSAPE